MRPIGFIARCSVFLMGALVLLVGCTKVTTEPVRTNAPVPRTAETATDPSQKGALAALSAYAEARRALDIRSAYDLLTPAAQAAFSAEEFASAYAGQKAYTFVGVEVDSPKDGFVRGYVLELAVTGARTFKYARFPYTLRYESGRWGVAQATGLSGKALKAFNAGKWDQDLAVVSQWLGIDPNAWDAYLERFYIYKDTNRPAEARAAWEQALGMAPPEEHPDLYDILALLYVLHRDGPRLLETAQKALDAAAKLGPEHAERYDTKWRAGVVIDLAFSYRYHGDDQAAFQYFQEARALDPKNIDVERFVRTKPAR